MNRPPRRGTLEQVFKQLESEPLGTGRLSLLDRGIVEAARLGDDQVGFDLRENLFLSCALIGRLDRCIPAIEWCLARCDAEPERFDIRRVLFQYKWVIEELPRHSAYSRRTIAGGIDDLEARFVKAGWGLRGPTLLRMTTALTMADAAEAGTHYRCWVAMPRDEGSDCEACEVGHDVRYRLVTGDDEGAIAAAAPLLDGRLKCEDEPGLALSRLPAAYIEADRFEEALQTAQRALDLIMAGSQFCEARTRIMQVLLVSGNIEPALRLLAASFPQAVHGGNELSLLQTCIIAVPILDAARRRGLDVPLLEGFPGSAQPDPASAREWIVGQVERLAAAFDERNGNTYYADFWRSALELGGIIPDVG